MKLFVTAALLVAFVGFLGAEEKPKEKEKAKGFDASKIEGKWKNVAGVKAGEKVDVKNLAGEYTLTKDTITIKDPTMTHVMTFKLDTTKTPVRITMEGKEGPAKGFTAEGIIALDGDELKLAYSMPGEKAPEKFESTKENKAFFFTLKRAK